MKRIAMCLSLLIPIVVSAEEFPKRKAGLWEIQTSMAGQSSAQKMEHCIDAATDAAMMQMGKNMDGKMGSHCAKNEFRTEGGNFIAETDCTSGGIRMISKTVFSGDFTSNYIGETITKYEPAMMGMSEMKSKLSARWVGPCEADQKPGDIIMPNGMKMNIKTMGMFGGSATQ